MSEIIHQDSDVVDLWVRAGIDGTRNGGCPVCHQIFMVLLLKSNSDGEQLRFNVKTVNPNKPLAAFKSTGLRHVPALVHESNDRRYEQPDEILDYIDHVFANKPDLTYDDGGIDAETACKDVFSKFCFFIKDVNKDPKHLELELRKINSFLLSKPRKFLCGEQLSHLDCQIMPKLHHIRLACDYLKSYKIPDELNGLWRYFRTAYETPEFIKSCPADQEILLYWADRPDTKNLSSMEHKELSKQEPRFTHALPDHARID